MKPRERVLTAMRHEQPDRVPLFYRDVPEVRERLLRDLECSDFDALLDRLEIDFRWVQPNYVGPPLEDPSRPGLRRDIWGVEHRYVAFSETAGYWEVTENPLKDCNDAAAIRDYPWPKLEWFDFSNLARQVEAYDDYAIMTAPGFGSPSLLQSPIQALLGDEKSFVDMALNPRLIQALVEAVLEFQIPFVEAMLSAANDRIDFFRIGDDFGTQKGLLISPDMWRQHLWPGLDAMRKVAKRHGAFYYHHSCGSIRRLIPDLIELGVDVLDPIQVRAAGMVPSELKREFGDRLCFSGGVDEQQLLPHGSPDEVRSAVFQLCEDMARGGGFFIGPTHNFQDDIPTDNIIAMYEAAREWT